MADTGLPRFISLLVYKLYKPSGTRRSNRTGLGCQLYAASEFLPNDALQRWRGSRPTRRANPKGASVPHALRPCFVSRLPGDRPRCSEVLRWTRSTNIWRRRASTYAMHDLVFAGELDQPFRILEKLLYDDEFWVQRAVGTWLRECWKRDRRRTEAFLRKHIRGLRPVTITVATERAPKALRLDLRRKARACRHQGETRP